jgi:glycosidase
MVNANLYNIKKTILVFLCLLLFTNTSHSKNDLVRTNTDSIRSKEHPVWSYSSSIYEVNIRQFTNEGTFRAFIPQIEKLKSLGIDILWLMPIHPIGKLNRKGSLGSYYSVKDYKAVNPEFGSLEDFKQLVKTAHDKGLFVIIDWVANHTSWDNNWTQTDPNFYTKDDRGNFVSPFDWTDVIDLNYDNKQLWNYMSDAMKFWVEECDIDGFRCDVAAMVPSEFWKWVLPKLESKKKIFMLAEAHEPELHESFDMTYNWQLKDLFIEIAKGQKSGEDLHRYFDQEKIIYPPDAFRMTFTTNHDENSWNGTDAERFGDFAESFAVISCVVNGMPLVYSGMEGGLDKRLLFFERDPIQWKDSKFRKIYSTLFHLKKKNKALLNGLLGGEMKKVDFGDTNIFSFTREKDGNKVFTIFNLSGNTKNLVLSDGSASGEYIDLFKDEYRRFEVGSGITINPFGYLILYKH